VVANSAATHGINQSSSPKKHMKGMKIMKKGTFEVFFMALQALPVLHVYPRLAAVGVRIRPSGVIDRQDGASSI
jgi:hypothetical protein